MPLLYFWRADNYRPDLDEGAAYHLNQSSPRLHDVELGDSVWAFTRAAGGRYALAAELVVKSKTLNPAGYPYGPTGSGATGGAHGTSQSIVALTSSRCFVGSSSRWAGA